MKNDNVNKLQKCQIQVPKNIYLVFSTYENIYGFKDFLERHKPMKWILEGSGNLKSPRAHYKLRIHSGYTKEVLEVMPVAIEDTTWHLEGTGVMWCVSPSCCNMAGKDCWMYMLIYHLVHGHPCSWHRRKDTLRGAVVLLRHVGLGEARL